MDQKQLDEMAEALRRQGLTWGQTNFAVSLVRNAQAAERERWTSLAQEIDYGIAHGWPLETLTRITATRVAMCSREQGPDGVLSGARTSLDGA